MHLFKHLLGLAIGFPIVFTLIALVLIAWPASSPSGASNVAQEEMTRFVQSGAFVAPAPARQFAARDGARRVYRLYGSGDDLLVFVHGSGGDSRYLARFATALASEAGIRIATLDMRGHGELPGRRGDVDHVDQQEWDIADLVKAIAADAPVRKLFVGGHSIGGGLALRYASGAETPKPAAVLLLSPYVSRKAPSSRPDSGGWAAPRVARFAGIEMLHRFGVHMFDNLPVVEFAVSPSRRDGLETPFYSWRLFNSVIPRADWEADIARIQAPILVLGAEKDVIFRSEGYAAAFANNPKAKVDIVPGVGHFELSLSDEAPRRFAQWLSSVR
jgi:non-heme chloroperoxidase